jgi:hypothetical protein
MMICGLFRIWSRLVNRVLGKPSYWLFRGMELSAARLGFVTPEQADPLSFGVDDVPTPPESTSAQPEASS